jgi:hypothetical protein
MKRMGDIEGGEEKEVRNCEGGVSQNILCIVLIFTMFAIYGFLWVCQK